MELPQWSRNTHVAICFEVSEEELLSHLFNTRHRSLANNGVHVEDNMIQ